MNAAVSPTQIKILVPGNHLMVDLLGERDELLRLIEKAFGGVEALAPLEQHDELLEEVADLVGVVATDADLVAPHQDLGAAERRFDDAQQFVALAQEIHHEVVAGHEDLDLGRGHECVRSPRYRDRVRRACNHPQGQPGGHSMGRPPTRCMCRWATEFRASSPTLNTSR